MKKASVKNEYPVRVCQIAPLGVGGISSMVFNICSHMDQSKVNFDYLTYYTFDACDEKIKEYGGEKYVIDLENIHNSLLKAILKFTRTFSVMKKNKVQILHINASIPYDILIGLAAKLAGVKTVVFHSHNSNYDREKNIKTLIMPVFKSLIPFIADYNIACSESAARYMFPKRVIDSKDYQIINNGIEVSSYVYNPQVRQVYRSRYNCHGKFVVGHIGRFVRQKNHEFIIDIFSEIHKKESDSILCLFGTGEDENRIKEKVKELGLEDSVMFYGTTNEVQNILQMMDVFLFPSLYEGLPVVCVEAQAAGLPVVASGTITEEVRITDLVKFVPLNESAEFWADEVLKYRKGFQRRNTSKEIIDAGFSIEDTVKQLTKIYIK